MTIAALIRLAGALNELGDVAAWSTDKLLAPILTGVFVGLALRASAIPGEINAHDARAEEMNTDLARWLPDREIGLVAQISEAKNLAAHGEFAGVTPPPLPPNLAGSQAGSQVDSGAFELEIERLMRQALHEYRDRASGAVREYKTMARSEGGVHRLLRRCRSRDEPSPLLLTQHGRDVLAAWRERQIPNYAQTTASVIDDPTRQEDAAEIRPLEEDSGLTWAAGAEAATGS